MRRADARGPIRRVLGTVGLSQVTARVEDALIDQHGAGRLGIVGVFAAQALNGCEKFSEVLIAHRVPSPW